MSRRLSVFVTVGMGPWPFDRLLSAVTAICPGNDVFVQTGTSTITPPCPHAPFIGYEETQRRIAEADVVITHAGNTVRLVQRLGKIPIAVAREQARGEMRNDHQVAYLRTEVAAGRVVALDGDLGGLPQAVEHHREVERSLLAAMGMAGTALAAVDGARVADLLDDVLADVLVESAVAVPPSPFERHPTARYRWAFSQVRGRTGRHLDLGIGDGSFAAALHEATGLNVVGADVHSGYLAELRARCPRLALVRVGEHLPFADASFDSATLLDVLEHTRSEQATLAEVHRVLRPGGLLVLTVPASHVFSFLDPDNVKFRLPRLHRAVYSARFGKGTYSRRFQDSSDGLRGDMAWERAWHTNYDTADLLRLLERAGFAPQLKDGANLFWRFFHVPALLAPRSLQRVFDAPLRADGRMFRRANLFVTAVRAARATETEQQS